MDNSRSKWHYALGAVNAAASALAAYLVLDGMFGGNIEQNRAKPIAAGTIHRPQAPLQIPAKRTIRAKLTAYCPCTLCCGPRASGRTAAGDDAYVIDGVAGANPGRFPNALPYRTKLNVPGVGEREVDDCGGGMNNSMLGGEYHFDVRFRTHEEARRFGVRREDVEVRTPRN
jgi:3D (Asp-Asp-Asp) domain-containing protein